MASTGGKGTLRAVLKSVYSIAWLCVAGLLLACQPLPRPFAHQDGIDRDILRITDGAGIYVAPAVFETTDETGQTTTEKMAGLADATVAALLRADLVATTGGVRNDSNFVIKPVATAAQIRWTVFDAEQEVVGQFERPISRDQLALLHTTGGDLNRELGNDIDSAARYIVELLKGEDAAPPEIKIHVAQVNGAPGSGNLELTQFMRNILASIDGIEVVRTPAEALSVIGVVSLGPADNGAQDIAISWAVHDHDGNELGTVDQGNRIPAGSLDGQWGDTARQIVLAASSGLTQMLTQIAINDADESQ